MIGENDQDVALKQLLEHVAWVNAPPLSRYEMCGLSLESMAIEVYLPPLLSMVSFDQELEPEALYAYFKSLPSFLW